MDALAAAVARGAKLPDGSLSGVYLPGEEEGLARLAKPDAGVALVPLPFLAKHGAALKLEPRLAAVLQGGQAGGEPWTLVAGKGRVRSAAGLTGFTLSSTAGYAPAFVRAALAAWGKLPEGVQIVQTSQVLSALRKAATGAPVAVLLDGAQGRALAELPFDSDLEVVTRSVPLPAAVVASVGDHLPAERWRPIEQALLDLPRASGGAEALAGLQLESFAPLDGAARQAIGRALGRGP
jgi:hypothetical protein